MNSIAAQLEGVYLSRYEGETLESIIMEPEATKDDVDVVKGIAREYRKMQARMEAVLCVLGALAMTDIKDEEVVHEAMCTQQLLEVMVIRWAHWEHILDRAQRWIEREERKLHTVSRRWSWPM